MLVATLNVKNAFNSVRWVDLLVALTDIGVPPYIMRVAEDYFRDCELIIETSEGTAVREITAGVAQGSLLGPDFWIASNDGLLRLDMPKGAFLVGYADDVAVVVEARNADLAQLILCHVMTQVSRWMTEHGLSLVLAKIEVVLLTHKEIPTIQPMYV